MKPVTLATEDRIVEQLERGTLTVREIAIGNACSIEDVEHFARSYRIALPGEAEPATPEPRLDEHELSPVPVPPEPNYCEDAVESTPDEPALVDPTPPPTVEAGIRRYRLSRVHPLSDPACLDDECPTFCSGCGCCEHCTAHVCRCLDDTCLCSIEDGADR